mmetsp:Transcript_62522/g.116233  ORF Transcript_62522/g.116233 Transcript_62522/m.116233 type:complete len:262 (+) Transcript_62522:3-788(+)
MVLKYDDYEMVLPIGLASYHGPPLPPQPPPEVQCRLTALKWCIIILYITSAGRLLAQDLIGFGMDLIAAIAGTFVLNEDRDLKHCYACLHSTPLAAFGGGGLQCLLPSIFYFTLNAAQGVVRLVAVSAEKFTCRFPVLSCTLPFWMAVGLVAQIVALCLSWQVYRLLREDIISAMLSSEGLYETVLPLDTDLHASVDIPGIPRPSEDAQRAGGASRTHSPEGRGGTSRYPYGRILSTRHFREHRPTPALTPFTGQSFQLSE